MRYVYRVESCEYDYSPTIGIFTSRKKAAEHLRKIGAKEGGNVHQTWTKGEQYFAINRSVLNNGIDSGEELEERV